jgi:hypothetical protein
MNALRFEELPAVSAPAPNRADVACFVGVVAARPNVVVPAPLRAWLVERRYLEKDTPDDILVEQLDEVPILIESFDAFSVLFQWESRDLDGQGTTATTYLGAAVRSFFAQGGRRCYVVRVGPPFVEPILEKLVPSNPPPVPHDRDTWRGVGQVFGLPDVSILCLPDLPDLVSAPRPPFEAAASPTGVFEGFVECSTGVSTLPGNEIGAARLFPAPRSDEAGYTLWATTLRQIVVLFSDARRAFPASPQIVAAVPLPDPSLVRSMSDDVVAAEDDMLKFLTPPGDLLDIAADVSPTGLASPLLQLVYPWAISAGSQNLPELLEPPDGVVAGVLARNALARGSFRSAALLSLGDVYDVSPALRHEHTLRGGVAPSGAREPLHLADRVSLIGPTPTGMQLLSDVTTITDETSRALVADEGYRRQAAANRLFFAIVRAAQQLGEESVFEPSGERLWATMRDRLEALLFGLWQAGALRGVTQPQAFAVRCDRSTMSQDDIDNGRVIATVEFAPSAIIDRITIALSLVNGDAPAGEAS